MEAKKVKLNVSPSITDLPNEMLLKIFEYLPQKDHYAVGFVSNHFQQLIDRTKWWIETSLFEIFVITEENVQNVKETIDKKNGEICFKRVHIWKVTSIGVLEYILQSIGKEIEYLLIEECAAFHILNCNVIYLKSLEIYLNNDYLENNGSFNLCFFPLLEELSFIDLYGMNSTTNKFLEQIKPPENILSLKYFKLLCMQDTEDYLMGSMLHHSSTLETVELTYFIYNEVKNLRNWTIAFSRMKNLKKLFLSGFYTLQIMRVIFSKLPKETPLEHLELDFECTEILTFIVKKWMNTLEYLELSNLNKLTDVVVMEFRKLNKLRVLKLSNCDEITNMGFLEGIAKDENIFIDELYLEDISNLDEVGLSVMVSRFPNLRILSLKILEKAITNTSLESIWRYSTRLRCLFIDCSNITDDGMIGYRTDSYSINRLRLLVKLTLINGHSLTDRTLIEAIKLPALRSLQLYNWPKITLKGIESLIKACPLLEFLSIPSTVFTNDIDFFVIGFNRLRQLRINGCDDLTENIRDHIKAAFARLKDSAIFHINCNLEIE